MPENDAPKAKDRGAARAWTDAELDAMATVTPLDVSAARDDWQAKVPDRHKGLIDAKQIEPIDDVEVTTLD